MAHQELRESIVQVVSASDPAGFVEQPDSRAVVKAGPFCPGQCPQRQGQCLGLACLSGLRDQRLGGRAEPVRVGRHVIVRLPRAYQEAARRLCPSQEAIPALAGPGRHIVTTLIAR